ncbi:coumaroyl-CoA:anthocyanidin 3-O-glucoside-6''-O-coumaroyltransferase 1-like [Hibiscus syriacus]|nr:coumaroyl-CoA:anthocyanidin 3-O-glucoside-6''-O-coumaroyltransferase 1-like [Hibiscus syriacus]
MAQTSSVRVLDSFHVSPPPGSVPTTSVPLSSFDLLWFPLRHVERLFFYKFPHPTSHFIETTLPLLKQSLSLTLQRFYPYSANIMCPQPPGKPYIRYIDGHDFIDFAVAESAADFDHVVADYPRDVKLLHPCVPRLRSAHVNEDGVRVLPVIAFQVTVFPNTGICIGSTYCHAIGDGQSFMQLMRSWTSVYRSVGDLSCLDENSRPLFNRDVMKGPGGDMESDLYNIYRQWLSSCGENSTSTQDLAADKVRATFVLSRAGAERLKHLVTAADDKHQCHISTFVVTCALMWVCLIKSKEIVTNNSSHDDKDKFYHFIFSFDCRNLLGFSIPTTYFGNCIIPGCISIKKSEAIGENGIIFVAKALGQRIKAMGSDWTDNGAKSFEEMTKGQFIGVAGSPKLRVYDTDFGWGRACKVELTHIDYDGATSMTEGRDGQGGIEAALALNNHQMDEFVTIFEQSLKLLSV